MKIQYRIAVGVLVALVFSMGGQRALAWHQQDQCTTNEDEYNSNAYDYQISTVDFPTSGSLYPALEVAGERWDGEGDPIAGTDVNIQKGPNTTIDDLDTGDGFDTVTLEDELPSGFIAQMVPRCDGDVYGECDIRFEAGHGWQDAVPHYGESGHSIKATFLHEVGHCLGFGHDWGFPSTLNSGYPHGANIGGVLNVTEDMREAARAVYADGSTDDVDVAISLLRTGNSTSDTVFIPSSQNSITELTSQSRGGEVDRAYCLHNLGTDDVENVVLKIYLSVDNDFIETDDTILGTFVVDMSSDQPSCVKRTVTIPWFAPFGSFWIGAIIDPSDQVTYEFDETNNSVRDKVPFTVNF